METYEAVIIGSGPAGYTAAIYCARANLSTLVLEGVAPGGALMGTTEVENFPGFPDGINGPDLMTNVREQAQRFGATLRPARAEALDLDARVVTVDGQPLGYEALIVATGSVARTLGIPRETELTGHGVSTCATCDGFFFRGVEVAVVGGGDSAMEEALFLTRFASHVHLIHRRDTFKASPIMLERVLAHPAITVHTNTTVHALHGAESVEAIGLTQVVTGERSELAVGGLFVAIGHDPQTALLREAIDRGEITLNETGYVQVEGRSSRTGRDGVFACGDLIDPTYRQAITAAGSGCVAALDLENYLGETHHDTPALAGSAATPGD